METKLRPRHKGGRGGGGGSTLSLHGALKHINLEAHRQHPTDYRPSTLATLSLDPTGIDTAALTFPLPPQNYMLTASANGRFVSVGAFTAEMKIWEVNFSREGAYFDTQMVMALKGHSSQVRCVGFSSDCTKAFTASLDGTLGIWNIAVRYHLNEDAKRIVKVRMSCRCWAHTTVGRGERRWTEE